MAHLNRPWLNRIGGYAPAFRPQRGKAPPGPRADDAPPGNDEHQPADDADEDAQPQAGEADKAQEDFGLEVPEEIDAQRQEQEEKRHRSPLNLGRAHQAFSLEGHYLRNLATRFARMVSKVAEDSADLPLAGDDEWDFAELLRRRFTGRMVHQCRMTRERRKVAVVLDTSPSCEQQARLFGAIALIAEELGDCEIFDAPNFLIMAHKTGADWVNLPEEQRQWNFQGRVVLAFGDFDGIDQISLASTVRGNKIYWFCCEERPQVLEMHREAFVKRYKGHYFPAVTLNQLLKAMRRVR